jgi:hypothetical protein
MGGGDGAESVETQTGTFAKTPGLCSVDGELWTLWRGGPARYYRQRRGHVHVHVEVGIKRGRGAR